MKRERGFYWVKWGGEWEVCEWTGATWFIPGIPTDHDDSQMKEIDERRIINPNE